MSMPVPLNTNLPQEIRPAARSSRLYRAVTTLAASLTAAVALGALGFSACLPLDGRPCDSGADCVTGWRCVESTCVEEAALDACSATSDCTGDRVCDDEVCVPGEPDPVDGGSAVDGGVEPDPSPEDAGVEILTRVVSLLDVNEDAIDVANSYGAVTIAGINGSEDVVVSATMLLSPAAAARVNEIEIDLSDVGIGISVDVFIPDEAAFAGAEVNLDITIPPGFEVDVFPGSSSPATVTNASGVDVINDATVTGTDLAGEIMVVTQTGDVTLEATLDQNIDITAVDGNILLSLPPDSAFQLDATSQLSLVPNLIGFTLTGTASLGVAAGIVGGAIAANDHDVILHAPNGSITIRALP